MSEPIGPGDMIECVNNGPIRDAGVVLDAPMLTVGDLYTVTAIGAYGGIHVAEASPYDGRWPAEDTDGFHRDRFRPISRRKSFETVLEALKASAHDLTPAPREPANV